MVSVRVFMLELILGCSTLHNPYFVALVLYTQEGREDGAAEEAAVLNSSLRRVTYNVFEQEWSKVTQLEDIIHTFCKGLSPVCPLLFISVMSHGRMGALVGSDHIMLPVNDLIEKISSAITPNVKLVKPYPLI